jgi:hypothetical protein
MRTVQARRLLDGDARSVLVRVPLLVREQVPYVSVPELALDEELLECDLKDLARALAQPVVGRHRVISGAYFRHECMEVSLCFTMILLGGFISVKRHRGIVPLIGQKRLKITIPIIRVFGHPSGLRQSRFVMNLVTTR